ncbi:MAG: hypothetical protein PHV82_12805, partial [Victivallaceae bacterium]|nr:hypothetical protein [Victivallaceae bacterium]
KCGMEIRALGKNAASMEDAANEIVRYFFDNFIDSHSKEKACVLVRLFKTHNADELPLPLRKLSNTILHKKTGSGPYKCFTLLASAGIDDVWMDRKRSKAHQAIPLPSEEVVYRIPMIRNLIKQMGLDIKTIIKPDPKIIMDLSKKTFNVFHVADAINSPYIPAQEDFVKPFGIRSVLGFGGVLPSGNVFVVIIFSRIRIKKYIATMFNTLALNAKIAIMPFQNNVFAQT